MEQKRRFRTGRRSDPIEGVGILDVDCMELEAVALEKRLEPVVFEPDVVIVVQVVVDDESHEASS